MRQLRSEALLIAGDLYEQSNATDRALGAYSRYVNEFPEAGRDGPRDPLQDRRDVQGGARRLALSERPGQKSYASTRQAGSERTGRTRTLAARSALVLAEQLYQAFVAVKLRQPFETSLKEKQQRMDATIEAMSGLVDYEIADVTAAATFYMAETYFDFSRSLMESERPADLKAADLEKFEADLDEAAFPFEEKAINVHEKNMEMLHAGVFNAWTQKSLSRLAEMVPGRYAKNEMSSGFIVAIDHYTYRSPLAQAAIQAASNVSTTPSSGGTTPGQPDQTTQPASGNAGTTPGKSDQTTQPAPGAGTTPSKPEQTTQPTPMAVNQGAVKHANPQ